MKTSQSFTNSELHQAIHYPGDYSARYFSLPHGDISPLLNGDFPDEEFLVDGLIPQGVAGLCHSLDEEQDTCYILMLPRQADMCCRLSNRASSRLIGIIGTSRSICAVPEGTCQ